LKIKREKLLITKLKETQLKSFKNNKTHQQKIKGITQKMFLQKHKTHIENQRKNKQEESYHSGN